VADAKAWHLNAMFDLVEVLEQHYKELPEPVKVAMRKEDRLRAQVREEIMSSIIPRKEKV
jgi:hypothetical protein